MTNLSLCPECGDYLDEDAIDGYCDVCYDLVKIREAQTKVLGPEEIQLYIDKDSRRCPYCGDPRSRNGFQLKYELLAPYDPSWFYVTCMDCRRTWTIFFRMSIVGFSFSVE